MVPGVGERELSSWKEIAAHLGVGVRTAQDWEHTRGLPIRRLPGPRGRVTVNVAELNAWRNAASAASSEESLGSPVRAGRPRMTSWVLAGLASLALITTGFWWLQPGAPAAFRVERNTLVVLDHAGREAWQKNVPGINAGAYGNGDFVWFGNLGGEESVLFAVAPSRPDGESSLICYGKDGREGWRFTPGRTVHTRSEVFRPPFDLRRFIVAKLGHDGRTRILVVSNHYLYYPAQVALLDEHGHLLREYWHSGHVDHTIVEHNGRTLLLAGVSNGTKRATLVRLDPDTMTGASGEENPDYQLQGFAPGVEVRRLLFPRSDINTRLEPYALVEDLWEHGGEITVVVNHRIAPNTAAVYYHLNEDLTLREMVVSSGFEENHAALFATRALDHRLSEGEANGLRAIASVAR